MDFAVFVYNYVLPKLPKYIMILTVTAIGFTFVYKHIMCDRKEIFILWACYFGAIFSMTDVQFMYMENLISEYYYINFLITTVVLYISILSFQKLFSIKAMYKNRLKDSIPFLLKERNLLVLKHYSTILFAVFVIISLLRVRFLGIGMTGIATVKKGGGLGAILHFSRIISPMLSLSSVCLFFSKYRKRAIVYLSVIIVFSFLSSSKGSVLNLMFMFFAYIFLNPKNIEAFVFIKRNGVKLILIGIACGSIIYTLLKPNGEPFYIGLPYRFVAFGDIYTFAYPNNVLHRVFGEGVPFIQYLTADFLTTFRIMDRSFGGNILNFSGRITDYLYWILWLRRKYNFLSFVWCCICNCT